MDMSTENFIPKYQRLKNYIKGLISNGEIKPGEKIPSQRELVEMFQIGRLTVRQAIRDLIYEGYLSSEQGAGTFVTTRKPAQGGRASKRVALLFPEDSGQYPNPHFTTIISGASAVAKKEELATFFLSLKEGESLEDSGLLRTLDSQRVNGVITIGVIDTGVTDILLEKNIPFVATLNRPQRRGAYYVGTDNIYGIHLAVSHLYKLGHRRIGMIAAGREPKWSYLAERLAGYRKVMRELNLEIPEEYVIDTWEERELLKYFSCADRPTAVVGGTDLAALQALRVLNQLGIINEVAVIGYGGIELGAYAHPPLTTIEEQFRKVGSIAMQQLVALMNGQTLVKSTVLIKPKLLIRESCGSPLK
ncbi:MAG: GntR family transcriptional regulator [Firmicutes bacterium]|nr:GntR family transcriptional regulator [Bacillota bacterium]